MNTDATRQFVMSCPHCKVRLKVRAGDLGTRRACPRCREPITVAQQPAASKPTPSSPAHEFPIVCRLCGTRFYANPSQVGQRLDCPDCLTEHVVEPPSSPADRPPRHEATLGDDAEEYQLQPLAKAGTGADPAKTTPDDSTTFHIHCGVCGTSLAATASWIGQSIECPDCGTAVPVTRPPRPAPKPRVVPRDPKIGISAAADLRRPREQTRRLMRDAHAHQVELDRQKPQPPRRPFVDGVYSYPFRPRVVPVWALLAPLASATGWLVLTALDLSGFSQIVAVPMFALAAVLCFVFALGAGHGMMTILHSTAMGYPQPDEWSRFDFGEWFGHALFLVSGTVLSILPVLLVGSWIPSPWRTLVAGLVGLLTFPFILISMLDADSPAVPFSSHVWRTLRKGAAAWRKFYLATGGVFLATAAWTAAASYLGVFGILLTAVVATIAMTVYFRLLGRLAWVLDQLPTPADEDEEALGDESFSRTNRI